jgi:hypothetical protein
MPHAVTWIDRLRIERAVWALDQRLYDLPRGSRIAKRREVRENLLIAAHDIGTGDALSNLGNSRQLAAEYLSAEFGEEPRASWIAAGLFFLTGQLLLTSFLTEAALAFGDGIKAADPHATGTFTWSGIRYLQDAVTYTFVNGEGSSVGGAWTPVAWAIWIVATVLVGRLWRVVSMWRRRHSRATART